MQEPWAAWLGPLTCFLLQRDVQREGAAAGAVPGRRRPELVQGDAGGCISSFWPHKVCRRRRMMAAAAAEMMQPLSNLATGHLFGCAYPVRTSSSFRITSASAPMAIASWSGR